MPAQTPASFVDVLVALRAQLVAATGLTNENVVWIAEEDDEEVPFLGPNEHQILLRVDHEDPNMPAIEGDGRYDDYRIRNVAVFLRTRFNVDRVEQDEARLLDHDAGHVAFEDTVRDVTQLFLATDAAENALALPCVIGPLTGIRRSRKVRGMVKSRFTVTFRYQSSLDPLRFGGG